MAYDAIGAAPGTLPHQNCTSRITGAAGSSENGRNSCAEDFWLTGMDFGFFCNGGASSSAAGVGDRDADQTGRELYAIFWGQSEHQKITRSQPDPYTGATIVSATYSDDDVMTLLVNGDNIEWCAPGMRYVVAPT